MNNQTTTAVILAAGVGSRLHDMCSDRPKGFLEIGGSPIVEQSIQKLLWVGITRIIIGTGYADEQYRMLEKKYPQIVCRYNSDYAQTGSLATLAAVYPIVNEDVVLLESDLIYDRNGLKELLLDPRPNVILASQTTGAHDAVGLETDDQSRLIKLSKNLGKLKNVSGELVGITKINYSMLTEMCQHANSNLLHSKLDYESALERVAKSNSLYVKVVQNYLWAEIDDRKHWLRATKSIYPAIIKKELSNETV